ncbi:MULTISPECIES: YybH family protein [unclassified Rhizobium]|uniref:YybH family protein n=1 Tax=unclassified Rhizobium TaxID=2613769 RepID=UPI0007EB76D6|nr:MULTISPECIES: DUF4440 domain-containing protein [unclassified Rhizobium]ANK85501.1 hypothetical protein AMK02_CH01907 [Rhizobium sp. N731]ANL15748.1 hypothetical protein AMJ97_CH01906 [Rhizobium sp. N1314]
MRKLLLAAAIALAPAFATFSLAQAAVAAESGPAMDEQAIRNIHERMAGLVQGQDADAIKQLYAGDAVLMAPGEKAVVGNDGIGARWARQFGLQDLKFSLRTEQLIVSASGDLAHDRGTYDFAAPLPQGPIKDTGKYVLVWQKIDGQWKIIADIFNSDPASAAK